jgi:hypothetical protein
MLRTKVVLVFGVAVHPLDDLDIHQITIRRRKA